MEQTPPRGLTLAGHLQPEVARLPRLQVGQLHKGAPDLVVGGGPVVVVEHKGLHGGGEGQEGKVTGEMQTQCEAAL